MLLNINILQKRPPMKKILVTFLLLVAFSSFPQDNILKTQNDSVAPKSEKIEKRGLHFNVIWRIYFAMPNQFGNQVWNDAYNSSGFSMGSNLGILKFQNFRLSGGFDTEKYSITDVSKAGNFNTANKFAQYILLSYDYKINNSFLLVPTIGIGNVAIKQKKDSVREANQSGDDFRLGVICDYSLGGGAAVFLGIHYITTKFEVSTNSAYQSYFEKSNQFQLTLGLKVH